MPYTDENWAHIGITSNLCKDRQDFFLFGKCEKLPHLTEAEIAKCIVGALSFPVSPNFLLNLTQMTS